MAEAAKPFVDEGARVAGPADLLRSGSAYASVYTRLRQPALAFDWLLAARAEAMAAFGQEAGESATRDALSERLDEMGELVDCVVLARGKDGRRRRFSNRRSRRSPTRRFRSGFLVPFAERAGLSDPHRSLANRVDGRDRGERAEPEHLTRLVDLQTSRLRFGDLAGTLERFADSGARRGVRRPHRRRRRVSQGWRSGGRAAAVGESAGDQPSRRAAHALLRVAARARIRRASSRSPAPARRASAMPSRTSSSPTEHSSRRWRWCARADRDCRRSGPPRTRRWSACTSRDTKRVHDRGVHHRAGPPPVAERLKPGRPGRCSLRATTGSPTARDSARTRTSAKQPALADVSAGAG